MIDRRKEPNRREDMVSCRFLCRAHNDRRESSEIKAISANDADTEYEALTPCSHQRKKAQGSQGEQIENPLPLGEHHAGPSLRLNQDTYASSLSGKGWHSASCFSGRPCWKRGGNVLEMRWNGSTGHPGPDQLGTNLSRNPPAIVGI